MGSWLLKRVVPFVVTLFFGIAAYLLFAPGISDTSVAPVDVRTVERNSSLKILSKARPAYTDSAREENVEGTVILRVTFLDTGLIGEVTPVKLLPNGLTEQAIEAARHIEFEPARQNGSPVSVTKQIEYTFSIY